MSVMKNINELFNLNIDDDIPIKVTREEPPKPKNNYPITEYKAISIAKKELTKEYLKDWNNDIPTYISLYLDVEEVIEYNNNLYYYIIATGGDISGVDKDTFWDGEISKELLKKLRCLIDVTNGKYIYLKDKSIK